MGDILYLIGGFALLVLSGKYLVDGAVTLASFLKVSTLVIGVTVVSLGTSFPELIVSINAALSGHPDISIGNVIGSNIANIALILGITAIILPIPVKRKSIVFDWPILMLVSIVFYLFILNGTLEFWEGAIFIIALFVYIYVSLRSSRKEKTQETKEKKEIKKSSLYKSIGLILASSVGLYFGADWLVKGASSIALDLGVSERFISISVIAFGTSVPELSTSIIAAIKGEMDISVGNVLGSNLFNLLGVLGVTSMVQEIPVNAQLISTDVLWMLAITFGILLLVLPIKKAKIHRIKGVFLLLVYIAYIYISLYSDKI